MRFGKLFLVALGIMVMIPAAASAQSQFAGNVTDDTGGALPGVTVIAASEVLIEGQRIAITDGTGQYQMIDLRPGTYSLTYELPGFGTQVRDGVTLPSDVTVTLDVVLAVGAVEETITVSGESPIVDIQQVERTEVLSREVLESIPTGNSLYSFGTLVPGIRTSLPDIGGARAMEQVLMYGNGAGGMDTTVLVDGMQVNAAIGNGAYQQYFNPQMSTETSFTTSGSNADTQRGGIRVNMIPQDGGNTFSGTGYFGGSHRNWQSSVWNPRLGDLGVQSREKGDNVDGAPRVDRIYDMNASLGGPIFRDKLWFFGSIRNWSTDLFVLNSFYRDGETPGIDDNLLTSGLMRLTWQASSRNKMSAYLDRVRKVRHHEHGPGTDIETAAQKRRPILYYTAGTKWTSTLTNRMLAEVGLSFNGEVYPFGYQPGVGQTKPTTDFFQCLDTPCFPGVGSARHLAQTAGGDPWYGGPNGMFIPKYDDRFNLLYDALWGGSQVNYPFKQNLIASLSYVTGSHNIKVGFENSWSRATHVRDSNAHMRVYYAEPPDPWNRSLSWINQSSSYAKANLDSGMTPGLIGTPDWVQLFNDPTYSRVNVDDDFGIYAMDSWTIDRLTLNYGLRADIARSSIPPWELGGGRWVGARSLSADEVIQIPTFGPDFSPRLSVAYDAFGTGKTALKFGWNRYVNAYGTSHPNRWQPASAQTDLRDWSDYALNRDGTIPAGCLDTPAAASCPNPYGTNGDNIPQEWEIRPTNNVLFGTNATRSAPADDLSRGYNDLLTFGIQQEVRPGLSVTAEWRRRWFRNPEYFDNLTRDFGDWSPVEVAAPLPYNGTITLYNIDNDVRRLAADGIQENYTGEYKNQYTGFELSFQGRIQGGGTMFGGWSVDTPGTSWFSGGGLLDNCPRVRAEQDNPNSLRFCNTFAYPTPYRHEFKVAGNYPLPWYDLQVAGAIIANAGGYAGSSMTEALSFHRTRDRYAAPFWTAENCMAPNCMLGDRISAVANGGTIPTTWGGGTGSHTFTLLPGNSVKFPPYWIQMDLSLGKVFDVGNRVRWETRIEGFNLTNAGFERQQRSNRGTIVGYQNATYEFASGINNGRIMRLSTTARW